MRILAVLAIAAFLACQVMPILADDGSYGANAGSKEPSIFQKIADSTKQPSRVLDAPQNKLKEFRAIKKINLYQDTYSGFEEMKTK